MYSGFSSLKIDLLFNNLATIPVVPDPPKGSKTIPFSGQPALIHGSIKSLGKVAKWASLQGLVVIVQTFLLFLPFKASCFDFSVPIYFEKWFCFPLT